MTVTLQSEERKVVRPQTQTGSSDVEIKIRRNDQHNLLHHDDDVMELDGLQRAVVTEHNQKTLLMWTNEKPLTTQRVSFIHSFPSTELTTH